MNIDLNFIVLFFVSSVILSIVIHRYLRYSLLIVVIIILIAFCFVINREITLNQLYWSIILILLPSLFINFCIYGLINFGNVVLVNSKKQEVNFNTYGKNFSIENINRGISIIGAAGSGKTESVLYYFLKHFAQQNIPGILHDYKDFELTEMAYPMFKRAKMPFYTISPHDINRSYKVNPIAPKYLQGIEAEIAVNQIAKVLSESLLEKRDSSSSGSSKFFEDALEGLFAGLIWKLRSDHPEYCTLPHVILLFAESDLTDIATFLESNSIAKTMAKAFLLGISASNQTAGVVSSFANAIKKIAPRNILMILSEDEVPLNPNSADNPCVISLVNHPKFNTTYSPVLASILNTVIKQMSVRNQDQSFLMMEEAPTIRLPNMHEIPATLRAYKIATLYVMQDKIQNDYMYGREAAKAILANLSYQFFGKSNDPDTSKYYEHFFEIIKEKTKSINYGSSSINLDTRVTKGEKDSAKIKAYEFFKLSPGEFVTHSDGIEKKIHFKLEEHLKEKPPEITQYTEKNLDENYNRILAEVKAIIRSY